MATTSDDIVFRLSAELAGFKRGMEDGAKSVKRLEDRMASTARNIQRALVALGVGIAAREFVQLADKATLLSARIRLVAGSAEKAAAVQRELLATANRTRVDFESIVTLYQRVGRSADELGLSQQRLIRFTETFSQALKLSGATTQEATSTVIQLSQALGSGELRGEELRSVMEQGGRAAKALADGLGVTIGELRKMAEAGELTSQKVIAAFESQAAVIQREFDDLPVTVGDALTVAGNHLLAFVGKIDNSSQASRELAKSINELSKILDDPEFAAAITAALKVLVDTFVFLGKAVAGARMAIRDFFETLNELTGREWKVVPETDAELLQGFRERFMSIPDTAGPGRTPPRKQTSADKKAIRDAERYRDVIEDLRFEMEQLGRSESEAAYQQELRNRLSAAGVTLESERGRAIEELTAQLHSMTEAHEAEAAMWEVEAAQANRAIAEINEALRKEAEEWINLGKYAQDALADAILEVAAHAEDAKEIIAELIVEIGRAIAKMLILKAIEKGVEAIFGPATPASGGKAMGGLMNPGNAYMVGESGPELVIPRAPSSVISNNRLGSAGSGFVFSPVYNIAPGVSAAQVRQEIRAANADLIRQMPGIVTTARRDGRMRQFT